MKGEEKILKIYEQTGALLKGHFLLSSGLHSEFYLQSALVISIPKYLKIISKSLARIIKKNIDYKKINLVVSPAMGGIIIGNKIGEELNKKAIFLERVNGKFALRRGFRIDSNSRVLIVEDVVTTGKSSIECIKCIQKYGGKILALVSIVDRSKKMPRFGVNFHSLIKISAPIYTTKNLPTRLKKIPISKPGSRFLK